MSQYKDRHGRDEHDRDHDSGHHDRDHGDDHERDHDSGHHRNIHVLLGTKGDNVLTGTNGRDIIVGGKGNDKLFGGDGNDLLLGGKGDDLLDGGAGNDLLFGDKGNDLLDGGAGSDLLFAGNGNDTADYVLSVNIGAKDFYDGGKGFDTLRLTLTTAERALAADEIAAFEEFLDNGGKEFHFDSFGLTARNFEKLEIVEIGGNAAPVALGDLFTTDEDTPVVLDVLANDTDADRDTLSPVVVDGPAHGTLVPNLNGTLSYTPVANYFGTDFFKYRASDGTALSEAVTVNLTINPVNDLPVAVDDPNVVALAEVVMPAKIRVAVLGREDDPTTPLINEGTTHVEAISQLANAGIFAVDPIIYTTSTVWAGMFNGYDVVVVGDSGYSDYAAETATGLFAALSSFVVAGNGVVTTGWFARALPLIENAAAKALADSISPIASNVSHDYAGTTGPSSLITISDSNHAIAGGLPQLELTTKFGWELAGAIDMDNDPTDMVDTGATLLATGRATVGPTTTLPLPAIAYHDAVGMGRTAYLGGFYLSSTDFNPSQAHNDPVLDGIFERAVAWAAGATGGPTASAKIDDALLLVNDTDVDASDVLAIDRGTFPITSANGAALSFDLNGDIVYTPTDAGLQQLLAGQDISDSFDYRVTDGNGGFSDLATVNLTVDSPLL